MDKIVALILFSALTLTGFAQSKKDFMKGKIKSYTLKEFDYSSGKEKVNTTEYIRYDNNGNTLEKIKYGEKGKIEDHTESTYDENGNKMTKTFYFPNGKIKKVNKYFYEGKLRITKHIYDGDGKLMYKEEYIYEKYDEEKE